MWSFVSKPNQTKFDKHSVHLEPLRTSECTMLSREKCRITVKLCVALMDMISRIQTYRGSIIHVAGLV